MPLTKPEEAFTISDLVRYLTLVIEQDDVLAQIRVKGEISNFKRHSRGHLYFTLKDENTRIRAVMFASYSRRLRFTPKDGDDVLIRGRVGVYERDGQVQLYVTSMQPKGVGDLHAAFLELKEKLEEEGLFSPLFKKPLPFLPRRVGVVTSAHGAAVRDIITTIRRRSPIADILLHPVPVQGEEAPEAVAEAVERMNTLEVDVIIVGRGGGSLEELWAFNEEVVARSIRASRIPVISAVGHETDTTISDFVADVRAATPTAAGELVIPRFDDLELRFASLKSRLLRAQRQRMAAAEERFSRTMRRPVFRRPGLRLEQQQQRLDHLTADLVKGVRLQAGSCRNRLEQGEARLSGQRPSARLQAFSDRLTRLTHKCKLEMSRYTRDKRVDWLRRVERLDALSPLQVMKRGYSLVYRRGGEELVKSVRQAEPGDLIRVRFTDGNLKAQVWGWEENPDDGIG
ncbi:exodeoxyribonuclease VII large subunit [Salinithrix halophila]|uniref:Exodeoxyribonuclease 7 large subunit n=1 Tax=Salinithrix halophila TaxID=1485204 RepID=A0ABV8JML4_9BACL